MARGKGKSNKQELTNNNGSGHLPLLQKINLAEERLDIPTMETWLWDAACKIRGATDAPKYKDFILPLIFYKRLSDVFDDEYEQCAQKFGSGDLARYFIEADHRDAIKNQRQPIVRYYIPQEYCWEKIRSHPKDKLGEFVTTAMREVATLNKGLSGTLTLKDYNEKQSNQRVLDDDRLSDLIEVISRHRLGFKNANADVLGEAYEYLLRKFAEGQGQSAGEFLTPSEVGWLIAEIIDPEPYTTIYDPTLGSGRLLIKPRLIFNRKHPGQESKAPRLFGQELNPTTYAIAKMNMFLQDFTDAQIAIGDTFRQPKFTQDKFLRITDIQDGSVKWDNVPYCEINDGQIQKYILSSGDIVVARIGATTGKSFLINNCPKSLFASYLIRIRTKDGLLSEFLNFYFDTSTYWQQINANKGGRLKGGVNIPIIQSLIIPLPPLDEQRAIAHTLRTIQKSKETRQKELELERERKAALMEHLFKYGTKNESRKQTEIGEIPENWEVVKLGDICTITTGTTPSTNKEEYYKGNIPFIKTGQIINNKIYGSDIFISQQALLEYSLKIYPPKTIFMAMYGQGKTRGQVSLLEICAATTQNTAAIVPHEKINSEFIWQYLMNEYQKLRNAAHQGQISHLNLSLVKQYKIALPSPEEQVYSIEILKLCDRKIQALEKEISLIDELFHATLEELMTGRLTTTNCFQ